MDVSERIGLGNTGVWVNPIGVGAGSQTNSAGRDNVLSLFQACWEEGLRYFDTAPLYNAGESERRLGEFLAAKPRDQFMVSTKVGRFPDQGKQRVFDYSAEATHRSLSESLERIGLDYLDAVIVHDIDAEMHDAIDDRVNEVIEETLSVLEGYRAQGVIKAIGISTRQPEIALTIMERSQIDCIMMAGAYTLLRHAPLERLFPLCLERDVTVLMASPYNTGILATGSPNSPFDYRPASAEIIGRLEQINKICARYDVPIATAAFQFPLYHPVVASVVVGQRSQDELQSNLAALSVNIPAEFWGDMKTEGVIPADAPTRFPEPISS